METGDWRLENGEAISALRGHVRGLGGPDSRLPTPCCVFCTAYEILLGGRYVCTFTVYRTRTRVRAAVTVLLAR